MRYRAVYFLLSSLLIVVGLVSMLRWGFHYSIDFTGGTVWEFKRAGLTEPMVQDAFAKATVSLNSLQEPESGHFLLKAPPITPDEKNALLSTLQEGGALEELKFETLGPSLGKELLKKTLVAVVLAVVVVLMFIASRFGGSLYGISAIIAMLHDSLILLGAFSLFGHYFAAEIDSLFVTAVLTILSFSVHDTIVVYDRMRELKKLKPELKLVDLANLSVTETLTRSVNNSMTIVFMLLALVLFGAETTRWFSVALLVGTVAGTYSSTFTAVPLILTLTNLSQARKARPRLV